jgi:hypothetical protein
MMFGGTLSQPLDFSQMTVMYRKIMNDSDIEKLHIDLDTLVEGVVENVMKINPGKRQQ